MADVSRPDHLDKVEIADRRKKVAGLYLSRVSQNQIAVKLGCSRQTVTQDVKALLIEWREERLGDVESLVVRELAELATIEQQAAQQFALAADPAWLMIRLRAKERRSKMLGLDAPTRTDVTSGGEVIKSYAGFDITDV